MKTDSSKSEKEINNFQIFRESFEKDFNGHIYSAGEEVPAINKSIIMTSAIIKIPAGFFTFVIGTLSVNLLNLEFIFSAMKLSMVCLSVLMLVTHSVWSSRIMDYVFSEPVEKNKE